MSTWGEAISVTTNEAIPGWLEPKVMRLLQRNGADMASVLPVAQEPRNTLDHQYPKSRFTIWWAILKKGD